MGCRSDYMAPTDSEKTLSKLHALLEEVETGHHVDSGTYGSGTWNGAVPEGDLDALTAELCEKLKGKPEIYISKRSLELQIWWRDHQKWDAIREKQEADAEAEKKLLNQALSKLSPEERKLVKKKLNS